MERASSLTEMFLTVNCFQRQGCLGTQLLPSLHRPKGCATSMTFVSTCTVNNLLGEVEHKAPHFGCFLFFTWWLSTFAGWLFFNILFNHTKHPTHPAALEAMGTVKIFKTKHCRQVASRHSPSMTQKNFRMQAKWGTSDCATKKLWDTILHLQKILENFNAKKLPEATLSPNTTSPWCNAK